MIVLALFFILLAVLIKYGKFYNLIAGYNTMSKEEKAKYDISGIATVMRNGLLFMAFSCILGFLVSNYFEQPNLELIILILGILLSVIYILIKSNSSKYRKD